MSEEIQRVLNARQALRMVEDLLYVLEHNAAPPIDWRPEPPKPQPTAA
jgi:hypothetical protein